MNFSLPNQSLVNKFIPKNKFFTHGSVNSKIKQSFIDCISKITWLYKLSKDTVNIEGTESVEEIQIFNIELKDMNIPKNVLSIIDKNIPYPILYYFTFDDNYAYGITLKDSSLQKYYFSDWNEAINFDFSGNTLEHVYQKIVRSFIEKDTKTDLKFEKLLSNSIAREKLEKQINILRNKIKNEKQFKKQVEIHKKIAQIQQELDSLL